MSGDENHHTTTWLVVGSEHELTKARKRVVTLDDQRQILVLAHDGRFYALDNVCIHRQRELHKGAILNGKLVCPGHQWAFALDSGWEAIKEQRQPTYGVAVVDGEVRIDITQFKQEEDCNAARRW
ncbi:MAG: Rieske (2Fe-2S) domain-containing protein [Acidimicrobiaceae bacterium]|nr:MAG: Rieske (2Fe-2S) domain-containing protein [Acidimicrobiaceae bacterium]